MWPHLLSPICFNGVVGPQPVWTVRRRVKYEVQSGSDLLSPSPRPSHHTDEAIATLKIQDKVHPEADLKTQKGEYRDGFTHSLTSALDGVGGQLHAPAALPPAIVPIGGWVSPRARLDGCGKSRSHRHSILGPSSPLRIAIPITLSRPPIVRICTHLLFLAIPFSQSTEIHPAKFHWIIQDMPLFTRPISSLSWLLQGCAYACWNHCTNQQRSTQPQSEKVTTLTKLDSTY